MKADTNDTPSRNDAMKKLVTVAALVVVGVPAVLAAVGLLALALKAAPVPVLALCVCGLVALCRS
jgi:hypothetical protein